MRRLGVAILVSDIDAQGGMEIQALELATRLARRGARVTLVTYFVVPGLVPSSGGRTLVERRGRLRIIRVPLCERWRLDTAEGLYRLAAACALLGAGYPIDAVYAVQWQMGRHAVRLGDLLGAPVVVMLPGGGVNGDLRQIDRSSDPRALATLARADRIVCISPEIEAEALARGLARERLVRIPNGVAIERFEGAAPAVLPGPPGAERVLYVGAFRREKRVPELVRAFAPVARRRPLAQLVLAGEGVEEPLVRAAVRELGLDERVLLLGRRRDVPALLASGRAFVLVSESEGLSNALLEALAASVPAVVSDIEANRAVVEAGREALLVPFGDAAALTAAIERLLADPGLAASVARAGRAKAEVYSLERVLERYETEFRSLRRPRPSSAALLGRYFEIFDNPGVVEIALRAARHGGHRARLRASAALALFRRVVSSVVVRAKSALGVGSR